MHLLPARSRIDQIPEAGYMMTKFSEETIHEELKNFLRSIDQTVEHVRRSYPAECRCKKGCADCCHAVFDISFAEATLIENAFKRLNRPARRGIEKRAKEALRLWNEMIASGENPGKVRIACPLLDGDNTCLLYRVRPVNCRTYGIPVEINGQTHVCGRSAFQPGTRYPSIKFSRIQNRLLELSLQLNPVSGMKRFPIAACILAPAN